MKMESIKNFALVRLGVDFFVNLAQQELDSVKKLVHKDIDRITTNEADFESQEIIQKALRKFSSIADGNMVKYVNDIVNALSDTKVKKEKAQGFYKDYVDYCYLAAEGVMMADVRTVRPVVGILLKRLPGFLKNTPDDQLERIANVFFYAYTLSKGSYEKEVAEQTFQNVRSEEYFNQIFSNLMSVMIAKNDTELKEKSDKVIKHLADKVRRNGICIFSPTLPGSAVTLLQNLVVCSRETKNSIVKLINTHQNRSNFIFALGKPAAESLFDVVTKTAPETTPDIIDIYYRLGTNVEHEKLKKRIQSYAERTADVEIKKKAQEILGLSTLPEIISREENERSLEI